MEQIKKDFGFGCMRLPINGENVDTAETRRMVDAFLDAGFNYFDTARGYLQGKSELALRECLTSRYPCERYILTDYPQIEVVQIQFNYLDYDDPAVQSRRCYEVCRKFGKPVIVMEPVKGGNLVNLPDDARAVLDGLRGGSPASYAIRFATMNTKQIHHDWNADYYYNVVHTAPGRRASDCVKCGRCEKVCPQHLPIRRLLEDVAKNFEKEAN